MSTASQRDFSRTSASRSRSAFTLTELLVVITIIAILASLGAAAVMNALWNAKQTRIKVEVDNLASAIIRFKELYGAYPPADLNPTANSVAERNLKAFIARAFPRYNLSNLQADLQDAGAPQVYNPAQALVFWLRGFSPDATHPFTGLGERKPLYDFDKTRLYPTDPKDPNDNTKLVPQIYLAPGAANSPFLYFDYRSYSSNDTQPNNINMTREVLITSPMPESTNQGYASPYIFDVNNDRTAMDPDTFMNSDSFQIISAGQDGLFGRSNNSDSNGLKRLYPAGTGYDEADADNITHFCDINNLNDKRP